MFLRIYALLSLSLAPLLQARAGEFEELWVARYNGPGNGRDLAGDVAVDSAGAVYVTGMSEAAPENWDYATVKYSPEGKQLWVARYNGPANARDSAIRLAVDDAGAVYVTGMSQAAPENWDYATVKYSPEGEELWVARYNGPGNSIDLPSDLAVDSSGAVYVTGGSQADYATVKYSPEGKQLWVARYNGPKRAFDEARSLAVDSAGAVYVTGISEGVGGDGQFLGGDNDYATVKYSPEGKQLWVARYNGPGNAGDQARSLAVDSAGAVYVTGMSLAAPGDYWDYATVKYSPEGEELWVARYNGPGNAPAVDQAQGLVVDSSGAVYVTGTSSGVETEDDYATVKYSPGGEQLWVARYNGPGNLFDSPRDLAVDTAGAIYVTGQSTGLRGAAQLLGRDDYATVKYSPEGAELWVARYNGAGNDLDSASGLAVDSAGAVYVTGMSTGVRTDFDIATVKYSGPEPRTRFGRGECNDDGKVDIADAVCILNWLFLAGQKPGCVAATNVDGAGEVEITDPIHLLTHLFLAGPSPAEPFPACGTSNLAVDETLGCQTPPGSCSQ